MVIWECYSTAVVREFAFPHPQRCGGAGVQRVWPCLLAGHERMFDHSIAIFQCGENIPVLPQTSASLH